MGELSELSSAPSVGPDSEPEDMEFVSDPPTHMLLYLTKDTFRRGTGSALAQEVRAAREMTLPVAMAHENDPSRGGCPFSRLLKVTPIDLTDGGLYQTLAIAFMAQEHRDVVSAEESNPVAMSPRSVSASMWCRADCRIGSWPLSLYTH